LIAGALVLWSAHLLERSLVQRMLPAFNRIIPLVDDEFTILTTDITQDGANESIRFRLNLSRPIAVGGQTIYPFGWGPIPPGGFQVAIVLGGALQPLMIWSRFLMGGGGLALGILFGGLAIAVAGRTMQLKP
jgi:hypothetical protein